MRGVQAKTRVRALVREQGKIGTAALQNEEITRGRVEKLERQMKCVGEAVGELERAQRRLHFGGFWSRLAWLLSGR